MSEALKLWLLAVGAALVYGMAQDQVTVRVCVEYFTVGHPVILDSTDPTLLALCWGVLASWWVGGLLGVPLLLACRVGDQPPLRARDLLRPIALLLVLVGFTARIAGLWGYLLATAGAIQLASPLAAQVPLEKQARFLANAWAHTVAYAGGCLGSLLLLTWVRAKRRRRSRLGAARTAALW